MARKVNPFAVCKAAGKAHRWPKRKVEKCIRAVKRQLGHITSVENAKVGQALWMAKNTCDRKTGDTREGCLLGLAVLKEELGYEGFRLSGRGRR